MTSEEKEKVFTENIEREDPLLIVIKGHLHLESELINLLESAFPQEGCLDASDLRFPSKVKLAGALGLLPKDSITVFLKLNSLRNKFAHNLEMEVKADDVDMLIDSLSKHQTYTFWGSRQKNELEENHIEKLRHLISVLFVELTKSTEEINSTGYIITNGEMGNRLKSILVNYCLKMHEDINQYKSMLGEELEETEDLKILKRMKKELDESST